ncbi:WAT1-related protein At4g15540-like [Punica granatum]|uniref:WAT1-related protein n=1 Tax=Punica granatum TaxID=22663 RepID=A0A6P8DYH3_PUNGR|nr:WAT1-related protein At4g15540-like [Punica granatum]
MWRRAWSSSVTFVGMIMAMMAQSSAMVVIKFAMSQGSDKFVLVLYSNVLSTILFLPCLLILRRPGSPRLTSSVLIRFFLLSLTGFLVQIFAFVGLDYSSPTLGTALLNLVPAFTFILSISFRMERLEWKSSSSQAKVVGTTVSIAGAFVVALYKGPPVTLLTSSSSPHSSWALGGFFLVCDALLISLCYIIQALILRDYPLVQIVTFFYHLFMTVFSALLALVLVKDPKSWSLQESSLVSVIYSSLVMSLLHTAVIIWCVKRRGPAYVAMFQPLGIIIAAVLGIIFLGDPLCRGSLIGAIVIVGGFYVVMWGKAKESEDMASGPSSASEALPQTSHKIPLLAQEQC